MKRATFRFTAKVNNKEHYGIVFAKDEFEAQEFLEKEYAEDYGEGNFEITSIEVG